MSKKGGVRKSATAKLKKITFNPNKTTPKNAYPKRKSG